MEILRPRPGAYKALVCGGRWVSPPVDCTVEDGKTTRLVITLHEAAELTGRVTDAAGKPLRAIAGIVPAGRIPRSASDLVCKSQTDAAGRLAVTCLPGEACTVGILARGHALRVVDCRRAPCDLGDIVLTREEESEKREEGEPPR